MFQGADRRLALHSRKIFQEVIQSPSALQMVEEILKWHAGAAEDRRSAKHIPFSDYYSAR
jgi:hypothetical protein